MTHWVPELLSPAGSLEKLKVAVSYGADAVYLGGQKFGLRQAAENFTTSELEEGVAFAHGRGSKVYVVLNSFLFDQDLQDLPGFLSLLETLKVDAVIVSDLGVIETVKRHCSVPIHLSTQASCLNRYAARLWRQVGVTRVVLGREVSIEEARIIKKASGLEMEMFVHGSMCMAYSGNCVISNYTQGRDSNRGGCAHSCRFEYSIDFSRDGQEAQEKKYAYFMSSKDLQGLRLLEEFTKAGIDSLKVEGRMKSHHYAGTIAKVYHEALNYYREHGHFLSDQLQMWESELEKVSHRDYHPGNLVAPADQHSIFSERQHATTDYGIAGIILEADAGEDYMLAQVRAPFDGASELELVPFIGANVPLGAMPICDVTGQQFDKSRPGMIVKLPYVMGAQAYNMLRVKL